MIPPASAAEVQADAFATHDGYFALQVPLVLAFNGGVVRTLFGLFESS